jgi:hypothetical protein
MEKFKATIIILLCSISILLFINHKQNNRILDTRKSCSRVADSQIKIHSNGVNYNESDYQYWDYTYKRCLSVDGLN